MAGHTLDLTLPRDLAHAAAGRDAIVWISPHLGLRLDDVREEAFRLLAEAVAQGSGATMRLLVRVLAGECTVHVDGRGGPAFDVRPETPR